MFGCCCCCIRRQALRLQQQLGIAAAECRRVVDGAEPRRSEVALQDLQAKNEALAAEARRCQVSQTAQLLSRRGRSLPANASGFDTHRELDK